MPRRQCRQYFVAFHQMPPAKSLLRPDSVKAMTVSRHIDSWAGMAIERPRRDNARVGEPHF